MLIHLSSFQETVYTQIQLLSSNNKINFNINSKPLVLTSNICTSHGPLDVQWALNSAPMNGADGWTHIWMKWIISFASVKKKYAGHHLCHKENSQCVLVNVNQRFILKPRHATIVGFLVEISGRHDKSF